MMLKKRILISLGILFFFVTTLIFMAFKDATKLRRDPITLMNKYYHFKESNPKVAKKILLIILKQNPDYAPAISEYNQNQTNIVPSLKQVKASEENSRVISSFLPSYQESISTLPFKISTVESNKIHSRQTHRLSKTKHLDRTPNDFKNRERLSVANSSPQPLIKKINNRKYTIQSLKEAGFSAILQGDLYQAIHYFTQAYNLSYEAEIAMQLAYLYSQLNDNKTAYQYFTLATRSCNHDLAWRANNALTKLVGQQTKILPSPFFSETYFNPFSQSRFGLTVLPFIFRLGLEQNNRFLTKEYLFLRRTQDNRSANLGEISQIYEDNVQITGIGGQIRFFKRIPLVSFLEIGAAYDLVYRNRSPWRWDLRSGFMYFENLGKKPAYYDTVKFGSGYYADWYGDATYFTRYNNLIGLIRTHQGIRLLEYHSSMLNVYMTGRVIADTRREFFNNIAEVGPGISFVPSNRFHLEVRFEHLKGMYLPAGASFNPYSKYYTNNVVQLLLYAKF